MPFQSPTLAKSEQEKLPVCHLPSKECRQAIGVRGAVICCKGNIRAKGADCPRWIPRFMGFHPLKTPTKGKPLDSLSQGVPP